MEGVGLVPAGGLIELENPPELGFGEKGLEQQAVRPNTALRMIIDMREVVRVR